MRSILLKGSPIRGLDSFENLVEALQTLPTIGKKSARSLAYHMVAQDNFGAIKIAHSIEKAIQTIKKCIKCKNLSEHELCEICSDEQRESDKLCIVSSGKDIIVIEDSGFYHGLYFVFESIESDDIERLKNMVKDGVKEVIFAFSPSIQNDALIYFIEEKLKDFDLVFSKIAQGVPTGVNLENVDVLSLSKALESRVKI